MITLREMSVFNSLYVVYKWLSLYKKSVIANFLFPLLLLMYHIATHMGSYNDDFSKQKI